MAEQTIVPVILSGGSGTRLWPLSRASRSKQFIALTGGKAMIAETLARVAGDGFAPPLLVGGAAQAAALESVAPGEATIVLEPSARNTAAAIALAALALPRDAAMLVMPSDHAIPDAAAFAAAVRPAASLAAEGWLVTFGVAPQSAETGYGYIRQGEPLAGDGFRVDRFVEKPDAATAEDYLAEGGYFWNGGIFLFTAGAYLDALEAHAPAIAAAARGAMATAARDRRTVRPEADAFAAAPSISVDYAVMEKAERVAVVPLAIAWSDIGSWDALHAIAAHDEAGNAIAGDVVAIDTRDCLVRSEGPLVATLGVSDLIVVATGDAVLVMPRGESQRVREIVDRLRQGDKRKDLL